MEPVGIKDVIFADMNWLEVASVGVIGVEGADVMCFLAADAAVAVVVIEAEVGSTADKLRKRCVLDLWRWTR